MYYIFIILAIVALTVGHLLKTYRWEMFIEIYEKPKTSNLLKSLSLGYLVNFFVPFRIGDIFRAIFSGKKMKNGMVFSLATIIVDRVLDIIFVDLIFVLFYVLGFNTDIIKNSLFLYSILGIILFFGLFVLLKYNKYLKKFIKAFASIFNQKIELKILQVAWCTITSFKDIVNELNKIKLILMSIFMWIMYLVSYGLFGIAAKYAGSNLKFIDIFSLLFSKANLDIFNIATNGLLHGIEINTVVYLLSSIVIIFLISLFFRKEYVDNDVKYLELLPHLNDNDRINFLENYFQAEKRAYFTNYIKMNRDVCVIQDYSAGSNATTMLCVSNDRMLFRKYSFGSDAEKLYDQIKWLDDHKNILKVTDIISQKKGEEYCYYDMPYINDAVGCFNYVHSNPIDQSWKLLSKVLDDLRDNLHSVNNRKCDIKLLEKYIDSKVYGNLAKIKGFKEIKNILKYRYIYINGKKYKNLNEFDWMFKKDNLVKIFKNDKYSDIHGDLTIENIICLQNSHDYYIIDPNTGNLHDSPFLDFGKLLQSIHGGYEFLMRTKVVTVEKDSINYIDTKSHVYDDLFSLFKSYLYENYKREEVKSIFYHEIIHWLRLMPYKINKDTSRVMLFYSGLIKVLNDVDEEFK